jgi:hypothetical protein
MEPSRSQAKKGILKKGETDPQFDEKQSAAHQFQLELTKEQNRHNQVMKDSDMGMLGRFFGDGRNTQTFVAFVAVLFGLVIFSACLFAAYKSSTRANFWLDAGIIALGFSGTALGYLFGKGNTNGKR